jgi:hypothetical protein
LPTITETESFNGAAGRISRLGLRNLWEELTEVLTGFELRVQEQRDSNSGAVLRGWIDERFQQVGGWAKLATGGVDWTKCRVVNGTSVCLGVEIQVSARSDLLIVDVVHLRDAITAGTIDVGVIVTASNPLAYFLTDRVARYSDAVEAVSRARAQDLPLVVIGILHDGPGPPLPKRKTR